MATTRTTKHINAPRSVVYRTLLDGGALAQWKVPDGMTLVVHHFEPQEGGTLRVSLTYDDKNAKGKSSTHTDTYRGRFTQLVADEKIVEVDEFETDDPSMQGAMTITITLADGAGGTNLVAVHEGLPASVSTEDNEKGWNMSLAKLATLAEGRHAAP